MENRDVKEIAKKLSRIKTLTEIDRLTLAINIGYGYGVSDTLKIIMEMTL